MFLFRKKRLIEQAKSDILECSGDLKNTLDTIHNKLSNTEFVALLTGALYKRKNEAAAKQILVIPFLRALGYIDTDENCVMPEWPINVSNHPRKVDYAISNDGTLSSGDVSVLVEAKAINVDLDAPRHGVTPLSQLSRYFNATPSARVAILSNGKEFRFYCRKIENLFGSGEHEMDTDPILTINVADKDYEYDSQVEVFRKGCLAISELPIVKERSKKHFAALLNRTALNEAVADACSAIVAKEKESANCGDLLTDDEAYNIIVDALSMSE